MVLLSHFKGSDSFTLDRNVVDADDSLEATTDSLETSTDSGLDNSLEHINQTSTEDNSLEAKKVKRNVQPAVAVVGVDYDYYQDSIESTTVDDVSLEDILEAGLMAQQPQTTVAPNLIQVATTPDDDLYDDLVNSTEDLLDSPNDTSLETNDAKPVAAAPALPSLSILNHLPVIGVFSHPADDDLYFVKQYMGDYYFWEMGDDYARNYFAQTVKDTTTFDFFETPIKVNADQLTQFTPVRSLPAAF